MYVRPQPSKDEWVRCGNCGHKLFKLTDRKYQRKPEKIIEIKCHSCKVLNRW